MLSWLPLAVPPGPGARHYAFEPSVLVKHCVTRPQFEESKYWERTRYNLEQIHELCRRNEAELIIVYAPTKPRVVLPLVADTLPADKVRAFAALRAKKELPDPQTFLRELLAALPAKETVLAQWCAGRSIPFISLTEPLRQAVLRGQQPYYTYNEHWTRVGQSVAAEAVYRFWTDRSAHLADAPRPDGGPTPGS
jgi:hypothetical protein